MFHNCEGQSHSVHEPQLLKRKESQKAKPPSAPVLVLFVLAKAKWAVRKETPDII